jgi:hypothetical protein
MADLTIKTGDTTPALRGSASDASGLMDLTTADKLEVLLLRAEGVARLVRGVAKPIDPPITNPDDPDGPKLNWEYEWEAGDTSELDDEENETAQGLYETELRVIEDEKSTPPRVMGVDNDENPTVLMKKALAP